MGLVDDRGELKNMINIYSVPKKASEKVMKSAWFTNKQTELAKSYDWLKKGTASEGIIHEAINLGLMSGMSGLTVNPLKWTETVDDAMYGMFTGAIAGGAFGGIGNVVQLSNALKSSAPGVAKGAEKTIKAIAGATVQGMLMHASHPDDAEIPTEMQVYEYLLGAYFGAKSMPSRLRAQYEKAGEVKEAREKDIPFEQAVDKEVYTPEVVERLSKLYDQPKTQEVIEALMMQKRKIDIFNDADFADVRIIRGKHAGKTGKLMETKGTEKGSFRIDVEGTGEMTLPGKSFEFKKPSEDASFFRNGEDLATRTSKEVGEAIGNLEDFILDGNVSVNRNVEQAAFQLHKFSRQAGVDVTKQQVLERVTNELKGKTSDNVQEILSNLERSFPDAVKQMNSESGNTVARHIQNYLKGKKELKLGHVLYRINDELVYNYPPHEAMSLLKNSGRPIKLTFCIMDELDKIIIKNKSKK